MNKIIIYILIFTLFLFSVTADFKTASEGNAGTPWLTSSESGGYTGFGSNVWSLGVFNYTTCQLSTNFDHTPLGIASSVVAQVGNVPIIIGTKTDTIYIFDMKCNLMTSLQINDTITAPSILTDFDRDSYLEIFVVGERTIRTFDFNKTLGLTMTSYLNYSATTTNLIFFTCPYLPITLARNVSHCVGLKYASDEVYDFAYNTSTADKTIQFLSVTTHVNELQETADNQGGAPDRGLYNNIVMTPTTIIGNGEGAVQGVDDFFLPVCTTYDVALNSPKCDMLNESGKSQFTFNPTGAGLTNTGLDSVSCFVGKVGAVFRSFCHYHMYGNNVDQKFYNEIRDLSGTLLYSMHSQTNKSSNWMVSDMDRDGNNDACYIQNTSASTQDLRCYHSDGTLKYSLPIQSTQQESSVFAMMGLHEFVYSDIVTPLAILQWDGSAYVEVYTHNQSISDGYGMVIIDETVSNAYVYSDKTNAFITANFGVPITCGDGICGANENSFNCLIDCNLNASGGNSTYCLDNIDCPFNYPTCVSNKCVSGYDVSKTCTKNDDCEVGKICYESFCVSGVFYGDDVIPGGIAGIDQRDENQIDAMWNAILGGSVVLKLILGFVLIILFAYESSLLSNKNPYITGLGSIIGLILATLLRLIPKYVFILVLVVLASYLILGKKLISTNNSGG